MKNSKLVGVGILLLAAVGFFVSFAYFGEQGRIPEYTNPEYLLGIIVTYAFPIVGLFFSLRFLVNKKVAYQISGGLVILLLLAYVIGLLSAI